MNNINEFKDKIIELEENDLNNIKQNEDRIMVQKILSLFEECENNDNSKNDD